MPVRLCLVLLVSWVCSAGVSGGGHYAGPEVCATCHKSIAATQQKTAMAGTWQTASASAIAAGYDEHVREGDPPGAWYDVRRLAPGFSFTTKLGDDAAITLPVKALVGGPRHGISFLLRIDQLEGIPLQRSALIEGRYAFSTPHRRLIVSPGFSLEQPQSYETVFGKVLSPVFERKCLTCHGQPNQSGAGSHGGVGCESCHGPGMAHIQAVSKGKALGSILNPRKVAGEQAMEVCSQCHTGFSPLLDPLPDGLLISSQVRALRNSECFIQSSEAIRCTDCHNPHEDTGKTQTTLTSEKACLGCHALTAKPQAGICPVNAKDGCVGCHMPPVQVGSFVLVDHWIRVHPEQGIRAAAHSDAARSQVRPVREILRILATDTREKADAARMRIVNGEDFFDVARQTSTDPSRATGGYVGPTKLADLDPRVSDTAARLQHGEISAPVEFRGGWVILWRLPRDFRIDAEHMLREAQDLKAKGDTRGALERDQQALKVNPSFLRALVFMGATLGETGKLQRAADVLAVATQLFPEDSEATFDLGIVLGGLGRTDEQVQAFRRAIEQDPDNLAAYESLGAALQGKGDSAGAEKAFRDGLQINPLSATLNFDLSLVLDHEGDHAGAGRARELALKINPKVVPEAK